MRIGPSIWRCSDPDAFALHVDETCPSNFLSVSHFNTFLKDAMGAFTDRRTSRERRKEWEPERVKELRRQWRLETDPAHRDVLRKKLFRLKSQIFRVRRQIHDAEMTARNRPAFRKSNRLFDIKQMKIADELTTDESAWVSALADDFETRWHQDRLHDLDLFQSLGGLKEANISVSESELSDAVASCKRSAKLDIDGLCVRAVSLPSSQVFIRSTAELLSCLLSSDTPWEDVCLLGFVKGKRKGSVTPGETRGLLPQTTLLQLSNKLVLNKLRSHLDVWAESVGVAGRILGSGKGAQTRDINFCASQVLEKGRDRFNAAAVAIGDIRKCHDEVPWGACLRGLLRRGIPQDSQWLRFDCVDVLQYVLRLVAL